MASVFEYVRDQIHALRGVLEKAAEGRDSDDRLHIERMDSGLCKAEVHAEIMAKCEASSLTAEGGSDE